MTLSYIFLTYWLILILFCFMRNKRKAISIPISERHSLVPLFLLYQFWRSCKLAMKAWRLLIRQASSRVTSIILLSQVPQKTAKQCFSSLQTRIRECEWILSWRMSQTYLYSSSKGDLFGGMTSFGLSMTYPRVGTYSSRMDQSNSCQFCQMRFLQYVSISSRQNFQSLSCFCNQFSKSPNWGVRRSVENMDYFFSKARVSCIFLLGLGLFLMRWVLFNEPFDSDSSELFSSIF